MPCTIYRLNGPRTAGKTTIALGSLLAVIREGAKALLVCDTQRLADWSRKRFDARDVVALGRDRVTRHYLDSFRSRIASGPFSAVAIDCWAQLDEQVIQAMKEEMEKHFKGPSFILVTSEA